LKTGTAGGVVILMEAGTRMSFRVPGVQYLYPRGGKTDQSEQF